MALIRELGRWQPVENESAGRDKELDFLGDFEELVDYDLTTNSSHRTGVKSKLEASTSEQPKKRKKRKSKEARSVTDAESTSSKKILKRDEEASGLDASLHEWIHLCVPDPILRALSDMKFFHPTPIQHACLPSAIRDGMDILGAAETGSGKTLAFAIPVVAGLLGATEKYNGPSALVLTPTRELALQIKQHVTAIAKYTNIKIGLLVGGLSVQKQERLLKKQPDIIIATPGRIWTLVEDGCEQLSNIKNVRYLVIDEIDRMVEKGHFEELNNMLHFLNSSPKGSSVHKRQTLAFSATLTFVHPLPKRLLAKKMQPMTSEDKIENLISLLGLRKRRQLVDLTAKSGLASTLTTSCLFCSSLERKDLYVYYFLAKYPGRTLIFANSISCVRRLRSLLSKLNVSAFGLHAEMDQKKRFTNLEKFERLKNSVLVASDVASRGLDIRNVDHVIHYQVPKVSEVYVHRSGRTARQSKQGLSLMLVDKQDVLSYRRICRTINDGRDFSLFPIDKQDLKKYVARVQLAAEIEAIEHRVKSEKAKKSWFRNAAKEADLPWDDEENTTEQNLEVRKELRARVSILEQRLLGEFRENDFDVAPKSKYPLFTKPFTDDADEPKSAIAAQARGGSSGKPKFAVKLMGKKKQRRQGARSVHKKGKKKTSANRRR